MQKIRKKSSAFHKHGKHKSVLMEVRAQQKRKRVESEMVDFIVKLFRRMPS